jgi:hypothetical protein
VLDVGSDRLRNTQGFLTKNVKRNILGPEILVGSLLFYNFTYLIFRKPG